jgi:Pectate lyase superfamily protein
MFSVFRIHRQRWAMCAFSAVCLAALSACGGSARSTGAADASDTSLSNAAKARLQVQDTTSCLQAPAVPTLPSGGLIDVTDFGAVPNDEVDDTVFIQRAISSARKGQWVYFPPGRYLHSKSLSVLQPGITLWGEGATLHATNPADQAIFLKADEGRMYGFTLTAVTEGRRTEPWTTRISAFGLEDPDGFIKGIVVQNNRILPSSEAAGSPLSHSASAAGILMLAVRDFTVAGNTVRRSLADGIHITGGSTNGRVVGNQVNETGDDMIAVVSYLARDWQTRAAQKASWLDEHREHTLVRNVWISGNAVSDAYWGRGISVVGGQDVTIGNNDISRIGMAAGVLVAREDVYHTHGVSNVLVQGNRIADVQTLAPTYVPEGAAFTDLLSRLSVNGARTSHGAIEVHNLSGAYDLSGAQQQRVVGMSAIELRGNVVQRAYRDGIRMGAGTHPGAIGTVALVENAVSDANNQAYENRQLDGTSVPLTCSGNRQQGSGTVPRGCLADAVPPTVLGAQLQCSAFPAP